MLPGLARFGLAHEGHGVREIRGDGEFDPAMEEGAQHREPELRLGPAQQDAGCCCALIPHGIVQHPQQALTQDR